MAVVVPRCVDDFVSKLPPYRWRTRQGCWDADEAHTIDALCAWRADMTEIISYHGCTYFTLRAPYKTATIDMLFTLVCTGDEVQFGISLPANGPFAMMTKYMCDVVTLHAIGHILIKFGEASGPDVWPELVFKLASIADAYALNMRSSTIGLILKLHVARCVHRTGCQPRQVGYYANRLAECVEACGMFEAAANIYMSAAGRCCRFVEEVGHDTAGIENAKQWRTLLNNAAIAYRRAGEYDQSESTWLAFHRLGHHFPSHDASDWIDLEHMYMCMGDWECVASLRTLLNAGEFSRLREGAKDVATFRALLARVHRDLPVGTKVHVRVNIPTQQDDRDAASGIVESETACIWRKRNVHRNTSSPYTATDGDEEDRRRMRYDAKTAEEARVQHEADVQRRARAATERAARADAAFECGGSSSPLPPKKAKRTKKKKMHNESSYVDAAKKAVSIEKVRAHEEHQSKREEERIAALEERMRIVRIGDAIQRGE